MTIVAIQTPWPAAARNVERPVQPQIETRPETAVTRLPAEGLAQSSAPRPGLHDQPVIRKMLRDAASDAGKPASAAPEPFPDLRFPDPLPNLPELDLPAKAEAYQSALQILR